MPVITVLLASAGVVAMMVALGCWRRRTRDPRVDVLGVLAAATACWAPLELWWLTTSEHDQEMLVRQGLLVFAALMVTGLFTLATRGRGVAVGPMVHEQVIRSLRDAVIVLDTSGTLLDANPAARRLLARTTAQQDDLAGIRLARTLMTLTRRGATEVEHTLRDVFGRRVDLSIKVGDLRDRNGRLVGWTFIARDRTEVSSRHFEVEQVNEQLRDHVRLIEALRTDLVEQANRDPLTGLYNRRHLMRALAHDLTGETPTSLAIIDIDHFKRVNDTHGHARGDTVLVSTARLLSSACGAPGYVAARHGGEEFVLFMPATDPRRAYALVESLRRRMPEVSAETGVRVTFSAGVATTTGRDFQPLLSAADKALYQAKDAGRDRVVVARRAMIGSATV